MKTRIFPLFIIFFLLMEIIRPVSAISKPHVIKESSTNQTDRDFVGGEVLITLIPGKHDINHILSDYPDISVKKSWNIDTDCHIFLISSVNYTTGHLLLLMKKYDTVTSAEPNYKFYKMSVSNDPYIKEQWYQEGASSVGASKLWGKTASKKPVVAVVDSGIDYTHKDIAPNMWKNPYKSKGLQGTYGYDFGDRDSNPMDNDGHGTHIAGIIAGKANDNTGIAGISPHAKLMAVKIFNLRDETNSSIIVDAFHYIYKAQKRGVNVVAVNCSWGGNDISSSIDEIMDKIGSAGALFTFASGNSGKKASKSLIPCGNYSTYAIKVGAGGTKNEPCPFSNYSKDLVDLYAPGESILSTVVDDIFLPTVYDDKKRMSLTSSYDKASGNKSLEKYATAVFSKSGGTLRSFHSGGSLSYLSTEDFLNHGGGCYRWNAIMPSKATASFLLYDITDLNLNAADTFYISLMSGIKRKKDAEIEWARNQFISRPGSNRFVYYNERVYMKIIGLNSASGYSGTSIYIDEIGISKGNPNPSSFGKYDFYSGTSMAAPFAAASIALLAAAYPKDTVYQRKARLLKSVTKKSSFAGKCKTGGYLNLRNAHLYKAPPAKRLKINASSKKVKVNKSIKLKASVYPLDASVRKLKWKVSGKKFAKVNAKGKLTAKKKGAGKKVKVTAIATGKKKVKKTIVIRIKG